jgi:NitT/TauT family transport system ATP-binding protein
MRSNLLRFEGMQARSQSFGTAVVAPPENDVALDHLKVAVSLRNVDVTFGGEAGPVKAVSNVTLQLRKREFVTIVGRSGCGKSTLLRVIAGLLNPSAGDVAVMGTTADEARRYRSFGIVFQSNVMLPWLTALENACLPLEVIGTSSIPPRFSPAALLEMVGRHATAGGPRQSVVV